MKLVSLFFTASAGYIRFYIKYTNKRARNIIIFKSLMRMFNDFRKCEKIEICQENGRVFTVN